MAYYGAYVGYLILATTAHDALPAFSGVMAGFVMPLTALTILVVFVRSRGALSSPPPARSRS